MYFSEKQLYSGLIFDTNMLKKIVFFWTILSICIVLISFYFLQKNDVYITEKKITIFTLDSLLGIHTKMITGDASTVTVSPLIWSTLTPEQKTTFTQADITIWSYPISESPLSKELQGYRGLYVTLPSYWAWQVLYDPTIIVHQIEIIRDALSDIDKKHHDYYHDNAGNYIYLLGEMKNRLSERINEYHKSSFITIGGDFTEVVNIFELKKHHKRHYKTVESFINDPTLADFLKTEKIQHIFVIPPLENKNVQTLEKKYRITFYSLPTLEADTSNWGYLRHMEKVINTFVKAFDTYD